MRYLYFNEKYATQSPGSIQIAEVDGVSHVFTHSFEEMPVNVDPKAISVVDIHHHKLWNIMRNIDKELNPFIKNDKVRGFREPYHTIVDF